MPPGHRAAPSRHRRPAARTRLLAAVLVVTVAVVGAGVGGWLLLGGGREGSRQARPPAASAAPVASARSPEAVARPAVEVLRRWDAARAAAYSSGSVGSLRELYARGAATSDVRLLRSYLRRGYRVEGMRMQLLTVTVLAHRPGRWVLRVTDRLGGGAAVGYGVRVALPRDRASTRTVRLVRGGDGRWRVASVRG